MNIRTESLAGAPFDAAQALRAEAELVDLVEADACVDLYAGAPEALARQLGLAADTADGVTATIASKVPDAVLNRVIGLGNGRPATERDLDALIARYRDAGVAKWLIHVNPIAQPPELATWLAARGFAPPTRRSWAKVIRGAEPVAPVDTALEVRPARPDELPAAAGAVCAAFGMPDVFAEWFVAVGQRPAWRVFVALDRDRVVGAGYLFLDAARRAAWLGLGGMRAEQRRHGAHRALMSMRIQAAIDAGATAIVTETGEPVGDEPNPSLRNMQRCGFRTVVSRLNFAAPG